MYDHFKRAAEYDPKPETSGAGYWQIIILMQGLSLILLANAIAAEYRWPVEWARLFLGLVALPTIGVMTLVLQRWRFASTPIPVFWVRCVAFTAFGIFLHILIAGAFLPFVMMNRPATAQSAALWIAYGASAAVVVLALLALLLDLFRQRRNAKGPASGEASASGTGSGATTG
jgi:hypothetical protein